MWNLVTSSVTIDNKTVDTYGISCGSTTIDDISLSKKETEAFVEKLNRFGASEIHAHDLAEDFAANLNTDFQ